MPSAPERRFCVREHLICSPSWKYWALWWGLGKVSPVTDSEGVGGSREKVSHVVFQCSIALHGFTFLCFALLCIASLCIAPYMFTIMEVLGVVVGVGKSVTCYGFCGLGGEWK